MDFGAGASGGAHPARDGAESWPVKVRELCHGINNHLGVIMGQADLLASGGGGLPPEAARRVAEIDKAAERIKALVQRAADDARVADGDAGEKET